VSAPLPGSGSTRGAHARLLGFVAALGLGLYLPRLGAEILRSPLEVKYALAAREMLRGTSPLLVPHLFGELYPDKPPLYFWATAGVGWLGGGDVTELVARLPAALAAVAGLLLTYRLGADLGGRRAGLLSACVLATSNLYFWYARQGHPDQFLTAFVTLACLALWRSVGAGEAARSRRWAILAYAAMGLGVLSKGLLGLILPLLAAAGYLVLTGPVRALPRRLWLHPGLWVFLAVSLAWYGPAVARYGREYVYETLVHQHVVRYVDGWVHRAPWYRYLGDFPIGFLPWVAFLPGAGVMAWRAGRFPAPGEPGPDAAEPGPLAPGPRPGVFPLAWFVTGFALLSLSSTKRDVYLLPLYPAAALMVGGLWEETLRERARSRWVGVPLGLVCAAAAAMAGALALWPRRSMVRHLDLASRVETLVPTDPWTRLGLVVILLAGAAGIWWAWRRDRRGTVFATLVAVQVAVLVAVAAIRVPQYEARYPVRALVARADAAVPPGCEIFTTLRQHSLLAIFYSRRPLAWSGVRELLASRATATVSHWALVDGNDGLRSEPGVVVLDEMPFDEGRVALIRVDPVR
jgi:4-amino-4-deoxy-L-arabinose transferase-like glycosyltransferase